ncbi:hypothetical protein RY831_01505 [Noviherbaspirillum sp. CPCC 100848]|uniref:Uncharacterized protein n=1 Tax=Noviherbaspirillum album TaxID=3080276 RepID=A0ABU6J2Y4_9BURK|nr:hypothetical protein [Noviherbaspirillum sp. CPCC 100848]MEC4717813.1 hypothetical protein [Noviherbaspirillum sp. CPCC 100848]
MKRNQVRQLKRAASAGRDAEAMQALLQRSVRFGHKRLALLRCLQAERMGLAVLPETLRYCREIADRMPAEEVARIVRLSSQAARPA